MTNSFASYWANLSSEIDATKYLFSKFPYRNEMPLKLKRISVAKSSTP